MQNNARDVWNQIVEIVKANINQNTFLVLAGPSGNRGEYLLQQINPRVFPHPRLVMCALTACIDAQKAVLLSEAMSAEEEWEVPTLIPTREGDWPIRTNPWWMSESQTTPARARLLLQFAAVLRHCEFRLDS